MGESVGSGVGVGESVGSGVGVGDSVGSGVGVGESVGVAELLDGEGELLEGDGDTVGVGPTKSSTGRLASAASLKAVQIATG